MSLPLPLLPRSSAKATAFALLAVMAGSACVKPDAPGVAVARLQSDIVFQAAEKPATAEVPNVSGAGPIDPRFASSDVVLEFPPEAASVTRRLEPPRAVFRAASTCPEAAINEFPDEVTPLNVPLDPHRLPQAGLYRWKKGGIEQSQVGPLEVSGFETRVIQNVALLADEAAIEAGGNFARRRGITFRYEMLQTDFGSGVPVLTTYHVKTNGTTAERDVPITEVGGGNSVTAGDPERGVVIEKIEALDGSRDNGFEPQTGLLLLPLRVRPGEIFRSVAVDPRNGKTMTLEGHVQAQERVDACGEILEGWRVESTIASSDAPAPIKYNYIIAPQFGAVLLAEDIERTTPSGVSKLRFSIGQKDPSPVQPQGSAG